MENQINEMIASQATSIDQSELEAELNMIMGINTTSTRTEELPITLPDVPTTIPIPTVTTEVVEEVTEDSIQLEIAS